MSVTKAMDIFTVIRERRSIGKVKQDMVSRDLIERILEAGTWAPNHHCTEPWKFVVLTGEGRRFLGEALAAIALEAKDSISEEEREEITQKQISNAYRAPIIITVMVTPSSDSKVIRQEELAAGHSAVQNMLLAAHALGLGAVWRTGKQAYHPKMRERFNLNPEDEVVGFLYIGYSDMPTPKAKRVSFEEKTTWINE